jgi:hypothetical protein
MPRSSDRDAPDVTVSIVSLDTRGLLEACLRSVDASVGVSVDVCVVDNGSSDGSTSMVAERFPGVDLVCHSENRGFAAANNVALARARGRYVLLLNPDAELRPASLGRMVAYMDAHARVGICGPRIEFPDGRFQSCGYAYPTLVGEIRQSRRLDRLFRYVVGDDDPPAAPTVPGPVDWVDGACLLIRREAVEQIGLLDEQYFLYAEELDWCRRAWGHGWQVFALPDVTVIHHQGQSSAQLSDASLGYLIETRLRYYHKHDGLLCAAATSLVYVAGCLRQLHRTPRKEKVKLRATARWWRSLLAA